MACASDVQASARPRVAGLQGLPREVLTGILQAVKLAALGEQSTPEEDAAWQESFLVPLRAFAHGLRDAVDALVTARSLSVCPKGARDVRTLRRVDNWLHHSPRRWPHLTALQLDLDWPADYLEFALMTIAGSSGCSLLSRLKLNVASPKSPRGKSVGSLDVGVLGSLARLSHLSLAGFARYQSWSDGLDGLTSVEALNLVEPGIPSFEMWPSLTSLAIRSSGHTDEMELLLVRGLRHLSLFSLSINILMVPETVETLQVVRIRTKGNWYFRGNLPNLKILRASYIHYYLLFDTLLHNANPVVLEFVNVEGFEGTVPKLEPFHNIESLVWSDNECPLPPSISTLTSLKELLLSASAPPQIPPLGALTCLERLTILVTNDMRVWPELTGLTRLRALKLSKGVELSWSELPNGLASLVALEELTLEQFHFLRESQLQFLTSLPRLHCLTLSECGAVLEVPQLEQLASLQTLHLAKMTSLFDLPKLAGSLTFLSITECPNLGRLPTLPTGNALRELTLERLSRSLVGQVTTLTSLEELTIRECPTLTSLTRLQGLGQLKAVMVSKCPLVRVMDVRHLPALKDIKVYDCPALERVDGLTERFTLTTTGCPQLR